MTPHTDDTAVDRFAASMKAKLAKARAKGRSGWDDPAQCTDTQLAGMLIEHLGKSNEGNFEDIANLCMMLKARGASPAVLAQAFASTLSEHGAGRRHAQPLAEYECCVPMVHAHPLINAVGSNETEANVNVGLLDLSDADHASLTFCRATLVLPDPVAVEPLTQGGPSAPASP